MKTGALFFLKVLWLIACGLVYSCQQLPEDGEAVLDVDEQPLRVHVRSAGEAELAYPVRLYAFAGNGKLTASQVMESAKDEMSLSLSQGDFQLVAVSGISDTYSLPESPTLNDVITLSGTEGADSPLMMGRADVKIGDASESKADIVLSYVVAEVNVTLKDVPSNVSAVQLSLSPLYSTLSMGGTYGGTSQKVKVDCALTSEGVWTAEPVYIFPGSGKETVFSIYFKTTDKTEATYGYTFQGIPEANHRFNVTGSYSGGSIIGGDFDVTDWEGTIDVEFTFGANVVPDDKDEEDENTGDPDVNLSGVPEVGTLWNNTIVAGVGEADETGVDLLLMTIDEWEATVAQVDGVLSSYSTNGISNWRVPTHEEAAELRSRFSGSRLVELNELIAEYDETKCGLANGENERYLCLKNGAYYSFRFVGGTSTTKAGEKRSYYLRLVKTYRFEPDK